MDILRMNNVRWERARQTVLDQITWVIKPGQHWVVMGANGSGKTSLLTLIMGYEWPTQGEIQVLGHRYGAVDLREIRKHIGFVSHHLSEWMTRDHGHRTVRELVSGGRDAVIGQNLPAAFDIDARAALEQFGLTSRAHTRFSPLSQGEKTRVLLARAWMAQNDLLILDEPCSGLDVKSREFLLRDINRFLERPRGGHVIYVTHHVEEILPGFTHVALLKEGRIQAAGPRSAILTNENLSVAFDIPVQINHLHGRPWLAVMPDFG